jgi:hypothetical protein
MAYAEVDWAGAADAQEKAHKDLNLGVAGPAGEETEELTAAE